MQIPAKSPFISEVLTTYIRQRISPAQIIALGVLIFLFSRPISKIDVGSARSLVLVIAFITVFRLYDDLMQARNDNGKPDRIYTDPVARKTLTFFLIALLVVLLFFATIISFTFAWFLIGFVAVNHLLYLSFIGNRTAAGFLPLLKYPFVYLALQYSDLSAHSFGASLVLSTTSLFLAFVTFESLEDKTFPVPARYSYPLQILSFALIFVAKVNGISTLSFFLLLSLSLIWYFLRIRAYAYVYLLCFFAFRFIVNQL